VERSERGFETLGRITAAANLVGRFVSVLTPRDHCNLRFAAEGLRFAKENLFFGRTGERAADYSSRQAACVDALRRAMSCTELSAE